MQEAIQAILGAVAALLAGLVLIGALAMLIVVEGYYLVGFSTRLYWRWKESVRQAGILPEQDERRRPPRPPRYLPRGRSFFGQSRTKGHDEGSRNGDD
jgi:hypothetical protein